VLYLLYFVNALTAALGAATLAGYILVYTPLKTRTALCTLIGAFPGAAPPMMGWTAARGELDVIALSLSAILFLWQMPHFFAIALFRSNTHAHRLLRISILYLPAVLVLMMLDKV